MAAEVSMERTAAVYDPRRQALRRVLRNRKAVFGMIFLSIIILSAVLAPWISPHDPYRQDLRNRLQGSSSEHWLGTDHLGRDLFTRIVYGGRVSLRVGFFSVGIALLIGGTMGLLGGYFGGWLDTLVMRIVDVLLAMPGFLLALAIVAALGSSMTNVTIAVGIAYAPGLARVTRSAVMGVREYEYVSAARAAGAGDLRIMFRHILPNSMGPIIVQCTLIMAGAILSAAALSFLGMGAQPPAASWGSMLQRGTQFMTQSQYLTFMPGLVIVLTVLAANTLGDGLQGVLGVRRATTRGAQP